MPDKDTRQSIPTAVVRHTESIAVRPVTFQTVDVAVNLMDGLSVFLEEYYEAAMIRFQEQGGTIPFTMVDFRRYVKTLIHSRCAWVRNERGYAIHYSDRVMVPAFLSFVLNGLGRVEIPDLGVDLLPMFVVSELVDETGATVPHSLEPLMSKDEALHFSNLLKPLSRMGAEFADAGYARDKTGAFDLMVMQLVEGQIVSHTDKAHPVYAVAAYFLGLLQVTQLLGPRVLYGTGDQMRGIMRMVATE